MWPAQEGEPLVSATDDALDVARFRWPEYEWVRACGAYCRRLPGHRSYTLEESWDPRDAADIAAAERVLVERGLGEEYGRALRLALRIKDAEKDYYGQYLTDGEVVAIRTAPLEVCLRAMARVVREHGGAK